MEERFGLPCEVENDVNCAGLAECLAGAAKGCASAVCLTIGTGIGGAILFHDRVYHGFSGSACEVGYMNIPGGMFQDLGSAGALLSRVAGEKGLAAADIDGNGFLNRRKRETAAVYGQLMRWRMSSGQGSPISAMY